MPLYIVGFYLMVILARKFEKKEIDSFVKNLDSWGKKLPTKERALLKLLIGGHKKISKMRNQEEIIEIEKSIRKAADLALQRFVDSDVPGVNEWRRRSMEQEWRRRS
jgi:hypothetical protein